MNKYYHYYLYKSHKKTAFSQHYLPSLSLLQHEAKYRALLGCMCMHGDLNVRQSSSANNGPSFSEGADKIARCANLRLSKSLQNELWNWKVLSFKLVQKVLVISKFYFFKIGGRWEIATEFKRWRTILVRLISLFHGIKIEQEKTFYSSTSYNYQPLNYPDLGKSVYIVHKEIPRQKDPEPAIPECFTKAVEKPTSIEAKQLHETLEPLNSVNQTGHGKDQAEIALAKPVKV